MKDEKSQKKGFFARFFSSSDKSKSPAASSKKKEKKSMKKSKAAPTKLDRHKKRNRKFRQTVDTNIVSVGFDILEQDAQLAAGDATF